MTVAIVKEKIGIYAGDQWIQEFTFYKNSNLVDMSAYTSWQSQWRMNEASNTKIDLTVDASNAKNGIIRVSATGEQTRDMLGPGVIDVQVMPGPVTLLKFYVNTEEDVTR